MQSMEDMLKKMDVLCVDEVEIAPDLYLDRWGNLGTDEIMLSKVKELQIPEGFKKIENNFFSGNLPKIERLTLPDSLEFIGGNAFYGIKLNNLRIGRKIKLIRNYAFSHAKIDRLEIELENSRLTIQEGALSLSDCSECIISAWYTNLGEKIFEEAKIDRLVLQGEGIVFGEKCCIGSKIRQVETSRGAITDVLGGAFDSSTVNSIDLTNCRNIEAMAFNECKNLGSIDISSCHKVGKWSFSETHINELAIRQQHLYFGEMAFDNARIDTLIASKEVYDRLLQYSGCSIAYWLKI